jgi:hypothetical protein
MEQFTVHRTNARALKFAGVLIGSARTSPNRAYPNYSGSPGNWKSLTLYRTEGGKYICSRINYTQWQGEQNHYAAAVCESIADAIKWFGESDLANELFADAGIDTAETID